VDGHVIRNGKQEPQAYITAARPNARSPVRSGSQPATTT
jgi:hypothetical protein